MYRALFIIFFHFVLGQEKQYTLPVIQFSHQQNLSQSSVMSILQDRYDYMWFGSQNGLNKFDGNTIKQFYKNDVSNYSLPDNYISYLYEDSNYLWIATGNGISRLVREENKIQNIPIQIEKSEFISTIWSIFQLKSNLFISNGQSLFMFDDKINAFIKKESLTYKNEILNIKNVIEQDDENILIQTSREVFQLKNDFSFKFLFHSDYTINDMMLKGSMIYCATDEGLLTYDTNSQQKKYFTKKNYATKHYQSIVLSPEGIIYIGTQSGLIEFNPQNNIFTIYNLELNNIFVNDVIMDLYFDKDGSLWIGTLTNGVLFNRRKLSNFELFQEDLTNPLTMHRNIRSFVKFQGNILFSSFENGFGTLDLKSNKIIPNNPLFKTKNLNHKFINTMFNEDDRYLWVGLYKGLTILDTKTKRIKHYTHVDNIEITNIWNILKLNKKQYLIGSSNGIFFFDKEQQKMSKYLIEGMSPEYNAFDLKLDSKNILWVATDKGLIKNSLDTKESLIFKYDPNNVRSISDNYVKTIHIDDNYQLWIGTRNGLDKFYPKLNEFKRFTTLDGLPNNLIYGILEFNNNLWVSTNNGLAKINKETLSIYCYDISDGLQEIEFNTGAYYKSDNYFYFGGINGFNKFDPSKITDFNVNKVPIITDIYVNNQSLMYGKNDGLKRDINLIDEIYLDYDDKIISIELSLMDFIHLNKRKYQYRMENFKEEWLNNDSRNLVSFTNLEPGEYTFSVRASTVNVFNSDVQKDLKIIIQPPIWRHWIFQLFLALLILAIVYGAHLNRIYHIRRENEILENANSQLMEQIDQRIKAENERKDLEVQLQHAHKLETIGTLAGGIAHDFNNLLTPLIGYSELLKTEFDPESQYFNMINNINNAAMRGRDLVQQILVFSREINIEKKSVKFSEIIMETVNLLRPTIPKSVEMTFKCATEQDFIYGSPTQLHQVVMNLCTNALQAIKDDTGFITLSLDVYHDTHKDLKSDRDYLIFKISDSGKGIPKEVIDRIFDPFFTTKEVTKGTGLGLSVVHGIIKNHEGIISVESEENIGTTFNIILPKYIKNIDLSIDSKFVRQGSESIVVIDDEEMILDFIDKILTRYGYKVKIFNDSEIGFKYIIDNHNKIDLLISDQTMPHLTGVQIVSKLNEQKIVMPKIIMTGYSEVVKMDNYQALGIDGLLMKPLTMVHVFEAIDKALKK